MLDQKQTNALKIYNILMSGVDTHAKTMLKNVLDVNLRWEIHGIGDEFGGTCTPIQYYPVDRNERNQLHLALKKEFGDNYWNSEYFSDLKSYDAVLLSPHEKGLSELVFGAKPENINKSRLNLAELCRRLPKIVTKMPPAVGDALKRSFTGSYGTAGRPGFAIFLNKDSFLSGSDIQARNYITGQELASYANEIQDNPVSASVLAKLAEKKTDPDSVIVVSDPMVLSILAEKVNFSGASCYLQSGQKK
jgi:hypothetical protein